MRRLSGTQVASLVAVAVAGFVAVFFEPIPPLIAFLRSDAWTRLIEWFAVSVAGLALLSWAGVTSMEFEISSSGIKARRVQADRESIDELKMELKEMEQDNVRLRRLTRVLREELSLHAGDIGNPDMTIEEDDV